MTTLPSRLRESARELRDSGTTQDSLDWREIRDRSVVRIAAELAEAADALEAGPWMPIETAPKETEVLVWFGPVVGVKSATYTELFGDAVWFWCVTDGKFDPHPVRRYCDPYPTHWMPLPTPPSAQVAQEGAAGVATRHPRCGYPYCACVGECFAASQPGGAHGVAPAAPTSGE